MPKQKPKVQQTATYEKNKVRKWFAISSILLLIVVILTIVQDVSRGWKQYQREFYRIKADRAEKRLEAERKEINDEKVAALEADLEEAKSNIEDQEGRLEELSSSLTELNTEMNVLDQERKNVKSKMAALKYQLGEARNNDEPEKAKELEQQIADYQKRVDELSIEIEDQTAQIEKLQAEKKSIVATRDELLKQRKELYEDVEAQRRQLDQFDLTRFVNKVLNAPLLDFINPTVEVKQVVLNDIPQDLVFTEVKNVDRCMTCHVGIMDQEFRFEKEWDEEAMEWVVAEDEKGEPIPMRQPFRAHPQLDLMLSPDSPHPMEKIGCTVCHFGSGHSLDFTHAAHMPPAGPEGAKLAKEWKEKYDWHRMDGKHWSKTMLPTEMTEATCIRCHANVERIPALVTQNEQTQQIETIGAHKINHSKKIVERYGCYNCHNMPGFDYRDKSGPDLKKVASKLDEEWMYKWIMSPQEVNRKAKMGSFFVYEEGKGANPPEHMEYAKTEVHAIIEYLNDKSEPFEPIRKNIPNGSAERGQKLFEQVGCLACHATSIKDWTPELAKASIRGEYGDDGAADSAAAADAFADMAEEESDEDWGDAWGEADDAFAEADDAAEEKGEQNAAEEETEVAEADAEQESVEEVKEPETLDGKELMAAESIPMGPNLGTAGIKFASEKGQRWLFDWLKNPQHYMPGTRMPSLRLTDQESADLVAYLMTMKYQESTREKPETVNQDAVRKLLVDHMRAKKGLRGAHKQVDEWSPERRILELGERSIARYGCYSCHNIEGFDGLSPIGPDLSLEGEKNPLRFDFGFTDVPHTRHDYVVNHIQHPRMWGEGKKKKYFERGRMPYFGFSLERAEAAATHVLGYVKDNLPEAAKHTLTAHEELAEEGAKVVNQYGCRTCHVADHQWGQLTMYMNDPNNGAPPFMPVGERLKTDWLHDWLPNYKMVRPGKNLRMPSYPFTEDETKKVVGYFKHGSEVDYIDEVHDYTITQSQWKEAGRMFKGLNCNLCHANYEKNISKQIERGGILGPAYEVSNERLRMDWLHKWLGNPTGEIPWTNMPAFWSGNPLPGYFDELKDDPAAQYELQIRALSEYVYSIGDEESPFPRVPEVDW